MDFVDDVNLVPCRRRAVAHAVDDLADIVNAGAAGGVHFQHVHVPVLGDGPAVLAHSARVGRRAALAIWADAVERPGDDPRRRRFADPPDTGQDKGLRQAVGTDGVGQRPHHWVLADQAGEGGRAVFSGKDPIGGAAVGAGGGYFRIGGGGLGH